jgi:hypothetical protein
MSKELPIELALWLFQMIEIKPNFTVQTRFNINIYIDPLELVESIVSPS